ncbi:hypothetical protein ACOSP7_018361 [Xanthoceras sorbifolium]
MPKSAKEGGAQMALTIAKASDSKAVGSKPDSLAKIRPRRMPRASAKGGGNGEAIRCALEASTTPAESLIIIPSPIMPS